MILIYILSITSFIDDSIFLHIMSHIFFLYMFVEYVVGFPLLNSEITMSYCFFIISTEISFILYTLWEYTTFIEDNNFIMFFLVVISLFYGAINVKI